MNLSDLTAQQCAEVIRQRHIDTTLLHQLARENPSMIFLEASNLDLIARANGLNIEFVEELEEDEYP